MGVVDAGRQSQLPLEVHDVPATIFDYIVVHELAHLIFPDHSAKFWNEVDKLLPDFQRTEGMAAGAWGGDGFVRHNLLTARSLIGT